MSVNKSHNPYDLPPDLLEAYQETERPFFELLQASKFEEARQSWESLYELFLKKQGELGYRLHKGGVVHNLGIVALFTNNIELAFKNFVLGFSEDVASQEQGFLQGEAEGAPGAQNLINFFGVGSELFNLVRTTVVKKLSEGKFNDPRRVFEVFLNKKLEERDVKDRVELLKETPFIRQIKYTINRPPGEWNKRVFIGGNYSRPGNLFKIKNTVEKRGYTPIMALEFGDQEPPVHDHSLLLLHNCKYAIFDVSKDSGYLMEVERTLDYRTETLLVYEEIPEERMSAMVKSLGKELKKFTSSEELDELVDEFLP